MNKIIDFSQLTIRRLEEGDNIESFNCGDTDLNDFILNEAPLYYNTLLAVSYIAKISDKVVAYFSLANDRVSLGDFESKTDFNKFRKHRFVNEKRLKSYPAVKVCRNARCTSFFVHHYTNLFTFFKLRSFEDFFDLCVPSI